MARNGRSYKKRLEKPVKSPVFDISTETKNSIWTIISFGLAVLSILAFVNMAGDAGAVLQKVTHDLFGWGIFLVPLAFLLLGFSFIKSASRNIYNSALAGTLLFVLSFLGIFYLIGDGAFPDRLQQGGYLGVVLGYPALKFFGFTASFIVLALFLAVSILVSLNISIHGLFFRKEEEGQINKDKPLKDNVIIKRGSEIITDAEDKKPRAMAVASKKAVPDEEKEFQIKAFKSGRWVTPPLNLLQSDNDQPKSGDISANVNIIKRTLANFGIDVEMGEVSIGPTVTQYTLRPAVGVKLSKISTLHSDLALALAAHPIRLEAPIPGKSLVGIEVPNKKSAIVGLRDLIDNDDFSKSRAILPLVLGRDVAGFPAYAALEKMPHLLVAGATGSGKSVAINSILLSLLYKHSPEVLKFIMIDPKRVELTLYNGTPHLITPVIVDNKKAAYALRWAVKEMERRYELLSSRGARDILSYNTDMVSKREPIMPYIIVVIDELADLMSSYGRDVEGAIVRLAQMARAVGIHLIVSTQRPSVEVITGLIKANITSRIAFQVASSVDSRTILDGSGAEKLLGRGDMLFQSGDTSKPRRLQGAFVTEKEVKDVVKFVKTQADKVYEEEDKKADLQEDFINSETSRSGMEDGDDVDDNMYEQAKMLVIDSKKASASLLQRRLRVGYARAARLLDILEEKGIIGPADGAKPREVYVGTANDTGETAQAADEGNTI